MLTLVLQRPSTVRPDAAAREVCVWRDESGTVFARGLAGDDVRWIEWRGLGVFVFSLGSTIVRAWAADGVSSSVVADAFTRVLQPIILQALGCQALHASAVLGTDGVFAFCGVGRSGKSTLAFALGQDGYRQVADDALVIEPTGSIIQAHLLPFTPGLRQASRQHFDYWASREAASAAHDNQHAALPDHGPLRAVFLLRQDDILSQPAEPRRVPSVQAFSALVTHARCFDEADATHTRRLVEDYLLVAERVPVFSIEYPPRFPQFPRLVAAVKTVAAGLCDSELRPLKPVTIE